MLITFGRVAVDALVSAVAVRVVFGVECVLICLWAYFSESMFESIDEDVLLSVPAQLVVQVDDIS